MNSIINIENLSICYEEKCIIENLKLKLKEGIITSIIGPNGAGKSTILKSITKLISKSGKIFILEKEIEKMSYKDLAQKIAMLLQQNQTPEDMTVERLIEMGRSPHKKWFQSLSKNDNHIICEAMHLCGIYNYKNRLVKELSGGERQRVFLAMALAQDTEILFLDEPTTYLDISFQIDILELIKKINKKRKLTVVMVLHDLNHAFQYSDEIIIIKNGKLIKQGPTKELLDTNLIRDVYNIETEIIYKNDTPHILTLGKTGGKNENIDNI